jgi:SAM-dependent methyltransferase
MPKDYGRSFKMKSQTIEKIRLSRKEYDSLHKETGFGDEKEAYEVLAHFLKGCKALDIGCGSGFIEEAHQDIVGLDFSFEGLKIAKRKGPARLVQGSAEALPFEDNAFDIALSFGVLEHCVDQAACIKEMARVSRIQILIVHARLPWGLERIRPFVLRLFGLKDQPIEKPLSMRGLKKMLRASSLRVIFEGFWNYVDLRWICRRLPYGVIKWPSHHFLVSIKSGNLERRFLGEAK